MVVNPAVFTSHLVPGSKTVLVSFAGGFLFFVLFPFSFFSLLCFAGGEGVVVAGLIWGKCMVELGIRDVVRGVVGAGELYAGFSMQSCIMHCTKSSKRKHSN